jgi:hypothetical protein
VVVVKVTIWQLCGLAVAVRLCAQDHSYVSFFFCTFGTNLVSASKIQRSKTLKKTEMGEASQVRREEKMEVEIELKGRT